MILAVGTRLAEANSSSWDPRLHVRDSADAGSSTSTPTPRRSAATSRPSSGVVADAKLALGALAAAARGRSRAATRTACGEEIARGARGPSPPTGRSVESDQFPLRPERILSELRKARARGRLHRDRRGLEQERRRPAVPITVPGTFITPSGLATMGFGPSAVLGVKLAQPHRAAVALDRRRRFRRESFRGGHGHGSRPAPWSGW